MFTPPDPFVGRCVGGEFEVKRLIASGGVGAVYEARQRSTGKARALKLMHASLVSDAKMRARFVDEARIAGSVESDHVVEVVSAGIDVELGVPWIAMELLRGRTLADRIDDGGPMTRAECLEVLSQARHGLEMAHARSLVHRDLKPENLFVAEARRPGVPFTIKVLDFGIAKWVQDAREGDRNSQIIGTPSWMAPEQLSNTTSITPATDVWALGLIAFFVLTGREYWLAANDDRSTVSAMLLELVAGARSRASVRLLELGVTGIALPAGFDDWFARCIDTDPEKRFADAAACVDALVPVLSAAAEAQAAGPTAIHEPSLAELPSTIELDIAFAHLAEADDAKRAALATSATEVLGAPRAAPATPRPTARRLAPEDVEDALWAGSEEARAFRPLAELLAVGLARKDAPPTRRFPDRIEEAVRHAALVLGAKVPSLAEAADGDRADAHRTFSIASTDPVVLGVPAALLDERSPERLRAHAAIALARTLPIFAVHCVLESAAALESARRAAAALSRGAVSGSPHFRALVTRLGQRRSELLGACALAEGVAGEAVWTGIERTVARIALLCAADADAVLAAAACVPFASTPDELRAELARFEGAPDYARYWHKR